MQPGACESTRMDLTEGEITTTAAELPADRGSAAPTPDPRSDVRVAVDPDHVADIKPPAGVPTGARRTHARTKKLTGPPEIFNEAHRRAPPETTLYYQTI